jgi:putative hemolysin
MESTTILRLLLLFFLLLLSGFFSGSETALFSLGHLHKRRIGTGTTGVDRSLRWLLSQPRRLIVTLLVGNELVNISVSTVVASLAHDSAPTLSPVSQGLLSMVVAVPLLLVCGEVTPKTIAIKIPEGWSRAVARPLRGFAVLITPLRLFVRSLADVAINLLGGKPPERETPLGEEEFMALVEVGSKGGELEEAEKDLIYNVFEFGDQTVWEVMTPAEEVFCLSFSLPLERIVQDVVERQYSRVPVYRGKRSHVVGILYAKDLVGFGQVLELSGKRLKELLRKPFFVPKSTKLARLFREFQNRRIHVAIVVDEYGEMMGIVTMEDLLEELFGELVGEEAERTWRGGAPVRCASEGLASAQYAPAQRVSMQHASTERGLAAREVERVEFNERVTAAGAKGAGEKQASRKGGGGTRGDAEDVDAADVLEGVAAMEAAGKGEKLGLPLLESRQRTDVKSKAEEKKADVREFEGAASKGAALRRADPEGTERDRGGES